MIKDSDSDIHILDISLKKRIKKNKEYPDFLENSNYFNYRGRISDLSALLISFILKLVILISQSFVMLSHFPDIASEGLIIVGVIVIVLTQLFVLPS
jgi:hypothetical protein